MKRSARLFALAEHLRGRRSGVTAEELARRFEVTIRTIYRDLDSLREAELPLHAERGRGGGYALDRAYALPPVNFTPREAALLLAVGAHVLEVRMVPFVDTLETALSKVRGALPMTKQSELGLEMHRLKFVGVPLTAASKSVRRAVEEAWFTKAILRIRYAPVSGAPSERRVRLDTVVMERTVTLLNVDDLDKGERRQFRLDRITWADIEKPGSAGTASEMQRHGKTGRSIL